MKDKLKKLSGKMKIVFGYGIMISLFTGGLTFFGYIAALLIGGEIAQTICAVIYKRIIPVMIYINTIMVLFGLITMYITGEKALTPSKKKYVR